MKKQKIGRFAALFMPLLVLAMFLAPQGVFAHSVADDAAVFEDNVKAGVNPDSALHVFDRMFDSIGLALTFDKEKKADRALHIAQERLAETEEMIADGKLAAAQVSQSGHDKALETVRSSVRSLSRGDSDAALEKEIELEAELEKHEKVIEQVRDGLRVKLEVKGNVAESQLSLVDSLMNLLQNQTGRVKAEIQGEKNSIKVRIRSDGGRSEVEIEQKVNELEERAGLPELRKEKASDQIRDATEELAEAKAKAAVTNMTNTTAVSELISLAEQKLADAQTAFTAGDFGEAFGQAQAAEQLAKNAERLLERSLSASIGDSGRRGRGDGDERVKITAEAFNNDAEVKVEVRFTTASTNRSAVLDELLSMVKLAKDDINGLLEIENGQEQLRNRLRTEVRIREGVAEARFELEFPLNTSDRAAIVDGIFSRLSSLTMADLEKALSGEVREGNERGEPDEREIEVEVEDGIAKVKVEVGGSKLRFSLPFTGEAAVFSEIAARTGLSVDEVKALAKVEMEDSAGDEDEDELSDRRRGADKPEDGNDEDEGEARGRAAEGEAGNEGSGRGRGRG